MRLQKFLARAGVASRRKCDEVIIPSGSVTVNGDVVRTPGFTIDPEVDEVRLDGRRIVLPTDNVTLMLNKPKGYETTMSSKHAEKIVASLVPMDKHPSLVPVGRLDKDTTGLLLFTTDGELCNALLHPARHVDKTYVAKVAGKVQDSERILLESGVEIDGRATAPAICKILNYDPEKNVTTVEITIHEGRNRQVRKMLAAVGHEVVQLHRKKFGPMTLGKLNRGDYRYLNDEEIDSLISACISHQ